jgi:hypothetical protein
MSDEELQKYEQELLKSQGWYGQTKTYW